MEKLNKYWNLSWWYIFNELDKIAHKISIKEIWECVTASRNINYIKEIKDEIPDYRIRNTIVGNKVYINMYCDYFDVIFVFIKRK